MKRFFVFLLVVFLLCSLLVPSVSAVAGTPIYAYGNSEKSGYWSPVSGYIKGYFRFHYTLEEFMELELPILAPATVVSETADYRVYKIDFRFFERFGVNASTYYDFVTLRMLLQSSGDFSTGTITYLSALNSDETSEEILFQYNELGDPFYAYDWGLYFGTSFTNYWYNSGSGYDYYTAWFTYLFSSPLSSSETLSFVGMLKPVVYRYGGFPGGSEDTDDSGGDSGGGSGGGFPGGSEDTDDSGGDSGGGAGPGGGGSGGGFPGGSEDDSSDNPAGAFSSFAFVIFDLFRDLLSIEFFGGFFTLSDLIGVVISFSLVLLFLKWFAGG